MTAPGDTQPGLAGEFRALAGAALDRLQPWVEQLCAGPAAGAEDGLEGGVDARSGPPATCGICPVCAMIALLRGERPELAVRLAEQACGVLAALRTALDEGGAAGPEPAAGDPPPRRTVQRIRIDRPEPDGA